MGPGIIQAPAFFEEMQPNPVRNTVGGARVIGAELAKSIVTAFLASEFEAARSGAKVERINAIERDGHQ